MVDIGNNNWLNLIQVTVLKNSSIKKSNTIKINLGGDIVKYKINEAFIVAIQTLNSLDESQDMARENSTSTFILSSNLKLKS